MAGNNLTGVFISIKEAGNQKTCDFLTKESKTTVCSNVFEKGKIEASFEIIQNMKILGLDIESISKFTGFDISYIGYIENQYQI